MARLQGFRKDIKATTLLLWYNERDKLELAWDGIDVLLYLNDKYLRKITDKSLFQIGVWNSEESYSAGDVFVSYISKDADNLQEDNLFKYNYIYRCVEDTNPGESPETDEDKWERQGLVSEYDNNTIFIDNVSGLQEKLDALVKYTDFNTDHFSVDDDTNEVSLNIDYLTLTNYTSAGYVEPDTQPAAAFTLSSTSISILEGNTTEVTVVLAREPEANVVFSVISNDTNVATVDVSELTFTSENYDTPQTVTITGVEDADADTESTTVKISISSTEDTNYKYLIYKQITVSVVDSDTPDIIVSSTKLSIDEEDTDTFTVRLATQPIADVTVSIVSNDTSVATVDDDELTFNSTTWSTPQTITVTAVDNSVTTNTSTTITLSTTSVGDSNYTSISDKTVSITNINTDPLIAAGYTLSSNDISITEGDTGSFTVVLNREPEANVIFAIKSNNTSVATVDKSSLTFTDSNWDTVQTITITGVEDTDALDDSTFIKVSISSSADSNYSILSDSSVSVSVIDTDTVAIVTSKTSMTIDEGSTSTFTIKLASQPSYDVVLGIVSNNTDIATVDESELTFTDSNWNTAQTITVTAVESDSSYADQSTTLTVSVSSSNDSSYSALSDTTISIVSTNNDTLAANEVLVGNTIWKTENETWWDSTTQVKYGYLYNGYVVSNSTSHSGLIEDMRIPTKADYEDALSSLSTVNTGAAMAGGVGYWDSDVSSVTGSRFIALDGFQEGGLDIYPGGKRSTTYDGDFMSYGDVSYHWTSTADGDTYKYFRITTDYSTASIMTSTCFINDGHSIRVVRDLTTSEKNTYDNKTIIDTVSDYDGNTYYLIRIGDLAWTLTNLVTTHYVDGTAISNITDSSEWISTTNFAYCTVNNGTDDVLFDDNGIYYPDNDIDNVEEYGLLYTWRAVKKLMAIDTTYRFPLSTDDTDQTILNFQKAGRRRIWNFNTSYESEIYENFDTSAYFWREDGEKYVESASSPYYEYYFKNSNQITTSSSATSYGEGAYSVRLVRDI